MNRNLVHTCSRDKEGRVVWNCLFLPELKFKFFDFFFLNPFHVRQPELDRRRPRFSRREQATDSEGGLSW